MLAASAASNSHLTSYDLKSFQISNSRLGTAGLAQQQQAPAFTTVTMLDIDSPGKTIPQSFMGFSHEWPYVEELYTIPQYMDIIKLLQSFGSGGH